ncbi:MAG: radical SAM protein, partial [Candidatus Omnitrophica bacterium]|nr:radical SAM protein [Candidatus Omnitrophota bacterium]
KSLGIYVNDVCNLTCLHCYYQKTVDCNSHGSMSAEDIIRILKPIFAKNILLFSFVGKEIFMPGPEGAEKTLYLMRFLSRVRESGRDLRLGAVTNGIYLDRFVSPLKEVGLDFLDISFDGHNAESHDSLRGKGSFRKSAANLAKAIRDETAKRVFVASTLYKGNIHTIANILEFHEHFGASFFSLMPIIAVRDKSMAISFNELRRFLSVDLPEKSASMAIKNPIEIILDLDSYVVDQHIEFFTSFFKESTVKIDILNNIILTRDFGKVCIILRINLPDPYNSYGCITHDGLYFNKSGCLFMKDGYEAHALGGIKEISLTELIERHEFSAAEAIGHFPHNLFAEVSDNCLNNMEGTTFYEMPKII